LSVSSESYVLFLTNLFYSFVILPHNQLDKQLNMKATQIRILTIWLISSRSIYF
jgi:hypothetical protein